MKRLWGMILILFVVCGMYLSVGAVDVAQAESESYTDKAMLGDVDGDGNVATMRDAMVLMRYVASWPNLDVQLEATDLDADGEFATMRDAMILIRHVAGWENFEILPVCKEHRPTIVDGTKATCTQQGLTAGQICEVCHRVLMEQQNIPVLGHQYQDGICLNCGEANEIFVFTKLDNGTYSIGVQSAEKLPTQLKIPAQYNGIDVTVIADEGFRDCDNLQVVIIPHTIEKMEAFALAECDNLQTMIFVGTFLEWNHLEKEDNWDENTKEYQLIFDKPIDDPRSYDNNYVYEYLGTLEKGAERQKFYKRLDNLAYEFHISDKTLTEISNYGDSQYSRLGYIQYDDLGLTKDEAIGIWSAFKNSRSIYYWMANVVSYNSSSICLNVDVDYIDASIRKTCTENLYDSVEEYVSLLNDDMKEYEILKLFHDKICNTAYYSYKADGRTPESAIWAHNVYGILVMKKGVCESYAKSLDLLLSYIGVDNIYVCGNANGRHGWNLVQMSDGQWYWVDVMWADGRTAIYYGYFCVSDTQFLKTHTPDAPNHEGVNFHCALPKRANIAYSDVYNSYICEEYQNIPTGDMREELAIELSETL